MVGKIGTLKGAEPEAAFRGEKLWRLKGTVDEQGYV